MAFWAERLGWEPLLCLDIGGVLAYYRIGALRRTRKGFAVDDRTPAIENLLALVGPRKKL